MPNNLYRALRRLTFLFFLTAAVSLAQGQIEQGPRPVPGGNSNSGGGLGIGINIDIGTIFNAIKNLKKNDEQPKDKPPILQKKAVTVSSGASGNYTIDWVVQYANNTGATLPNATIVDGPIAIIIPGSLQQPPGWTGTTNSTPPPDNFAKWTGANVAPHGVMTATLVASSGPPTAPLAGSGDGYQPIPYTRTAVPAGRRFYFMAHHEDENSAVFNCINADGTKCATTGTWPRKLPSGNGGSSGTVANNAEYVIDSGKMYYASQGSGGRGIGCFNLETDLECGFTKFANQGPLINGPWRVGNELYVAASDGALYCATVGAMGKCLGTDFLIPASLIKINSDISNVYGTGYLAGKVIGSRLYITNKSALNGNTKYTNCFDTVAKDACWNTTVPTRGTAPFNYPGEVHAGNNGNYNVSNFTYFDTAGVPVALCTMASNPAKQTCVDISIDPKTGKSSGLERIGLPIVFPGLGMGAGLETNIGNKTYFVRSAYQTNTISGIDDAWCWDWTTQKGCTSAGGKIAIAPVIAGSSTGTYGSNQDDQGCVWSYGHARILWGFNPANINAQTGLAEPCGSASGGKSVSVFQPLQYCSGPKPFRWLNVEVKGATLSNYTKFIVKVLDSSTNAVLLSKDLMPSGPMKVDISSLDAQTISKPLKIEIEYTPKPGATDKPYLEVRYDAPPAEFCFKSKHTCSQKSISNLVETPDPSKPQNMVAVTVNVPAPQNCVVIDLPVCGQPGQPPCPTCGTPTTPACPACGLAGQPPCPVCGTANTPACNSCGMPGQPPCVCIPGTPGCFPLPPPVCSPGSAGWPACLTCANPPCAGTPKVVVDAVCLNPPCAEKPKQSVSEEFKETKTGCVRKIKPAQETSDAPKPKPVVKPKPKPVAGDAAVASNRAAQSAGVTPTPKPKPRPVVKAKPKSGDDCE